MNSDEIERFLSRRLTDFDGVFSIDTLPDRPRLLVCNTDPSDKPGRHWVAIYVDDDGNRGEFFDSFGRRPDDVFERYMNRHCSSWIFNGRQLQAERSINLRDNIYSTYVYCDLVEHVSVGDRKAPLLRIVDKPKRVGGNVHQVMNPIAYVPLQKKCFDTVEINIMTDCD